MDGVMTDFDSILVQRYPKEMAEKDANTHIPLTDEDWDYFNSDPKFWSHMPMMPDFRQLWNYIAPYNPHVLTAWSGEESKAALGKFYWVINNADRNYDIEKFHCVKRVHKKDYASPTSVLIDDYRRNIEEWIEHGGIGILHTSAEDSIRQLKLLGI
jgi:hypothetical protein